MTSRSKVENREYMRDYMRERRDSKRNRDKDLARKRAEYTSEAPGIHSRGDFVCRDLALYDPHRDDPVASRGSDRADDGRPPIGRRAIDQHKARTSIRSISLAGVQP